MIRIEEAIASAKRRGLDVNKKKLSDVLYPHLGNERSRQTNLSNLCNGRKKSITEDAILTICKVCQVTPNYLFGYEN